MDYELITWLIDSLCHGICLFFVSESETTMMYIGATKAATYIYYLTRHLDILNIRWIQAFFMKKIIEFLWARDTDNFKRM